MLHVINNNLKPLNSRLSREVKQLVSKGLYLETLQLYKAQIHPSPVYSNTSILPSIIKACSFSASHPFGLQLHCIAIKSGSNSEIVISNAIISMYAKFSRAESACHVFDEMPQRDRITWAAMVNCYLQSGWYKKSLETFSSMYGFGHSPKPELVAAVISACGRTENVRLGKQIHARAIFDRSEDSVFLSTALVDMYSRCHETLMAFQVFQRMQYKNEVSWSAMVSGCIGNEEYDMALHCFHAMQQEGGLKPNKVTLICILPAIAEMGCLQSGREIHAYVIRHGYDFDVRLSSALLHMYSECGEALNRLRVIFERCDVKDVVVWSTIIRCYTRVGKGIDAIKLFSRMCQEGVQPNSVTTLAIISACSTLCSLILGEVVHGYALKSGLIYTHTFINNSLIDMYSKCGSLRASHQIFSEMEEPDLVSWSALIGGYGLHGHGKEVLELLHEMEERGIEPDAIALLSVISGCNHAGLVEEGQRLFKKAVAGKKIELGSEHYSCLVDLLGRSGNLKDACEVIRTMPVEPNSKHWTSLISACMANGRMDIAKILVGQVIEFEPENSANYTMLSMVMAQMSDWFGVEDARRAMMRVKRSYGFSRIQLDGLVL